MAGVARLALGAADASESRFAVDGVGEEALVGAAAGAVAEQVGGEDAVVVVGGVGGGGSAGDVAESADAVDLGAEAVVDGDEAAVVGVDAGLVEAEVVGERVGDAGVLAGEGMAPRWSSVTRLPKRRNIWANSTPT